jgi:hypothetical protein
LVGFVVGIARRRTPPVGDGAETRTVQQKQHPLRLLIGAWLWLRRSHVQGVDTGERTIPREPPLTDSARPVAIPSSEYVH